MKQPHRNSPWYDGFIVLKLPKHKISHECDVPDVDGVPLKTKIQCRICGKKWKLKYTSWDYGVPYIKWHKVLF